MTDIQTTKTKAIFENFNSNEFSPRGYLTQYYTIVDDENNELLTFYIDCYKTIKEGGILLEFGGGPTLYSLIHAAKKVREIHFCDFLDKNLEEIRLWKKKDVRSFTWNMFIQRALELEGNTYPTDRDIREREELIRKKLITFLHCNAFSTSPLGIKCTNFYDIVQANFVAESITSSKEEWLKALRNIASLVKPGGSFICTALKNATYYHLGQKNFPAVSISEVDIITALVMNGFKKNDMYIKVIPANLPHRGYDGFIFVKAEKNS